MTDTAAQPTAPAPPPLRMLWLCRNGEIEEVSVWPGRPGHQYEVYVPQEAQYVTLGQNAFESRQEATERAARYLTRGLRTIVRRLRDLGLSATATVEGLDVRSSVFAARFGIPAPGKHEATDAET